MRTDRLQPDEQRPAMGDANAGRRKTVPMTAEEKQRQKDRLLEVSDDVKEDAMKYVGNFITKTMKKWGFTLRNGPFCYQEMQGDAVKVISWDCYSAIYYGERRWPEGMDLKVVLAGIAWSKMDHIVRAYGYRKSHPEVSTDDEDMPRALELEIEEATGAFSMEMGMRNLGIEIAVKAVGDNEEFLLYLEALKEVNSYEYMAEKMHMTIRKVQKIEAKLLKFLENC
mgnify:CR=1 FL=1